MDGLEEKNMIRHFGQRRVTNEAAKKRRRRRGLQSSSCQPPLFADTCLGSLQGLLSTTTTTTLQKLTRTFQPFHNRKQQEQPKGQSGRLVGCLVECRKRELRWRRKEGHPQNNASSSRRDTLDCSLRGIQKTEARLSRSVTNVY